MTDDDMARVRAYESDKERINDLRQGDDTQMDVIRRLLEDGPYDLDAEAIFERLSNLEDIAGANNEQREQFRETLADIRHELESGGDVDRDALARAVAERLDYAAVADRVAEQVVGGIKEELR